MPLQGQLVGIGLLASHSGPPACWPRLARTTHPACCKPVCPQVGGISFVMIAKALGVQKAAEPAADPAPASGKDAKKKK